MKIPGGGRTFEHGNGTVRTANEPLDLRFTDDELDAERERICSFTEEHVDRTEEEWV